MLMMMARWRGSYGCVGERPTDGDSSASEIEGTEKDTLQQKKLTWADVVIKGTTQHQSEAIEPTQEIILSS